MKEVKETEKIEETDKVQEKETAKIKPNANSESKQGSKIAVILVRGMVEVRQPIKDTIAMLRLTRKNTCVIIDNNPVNVGMIKKVKDYVTWGEISEEVLKELVEKRGEEFQGRLTDSKGKYSYKAAEYDGKKYKPYFRLNPPRKGFGRKGVKMPFKVGGGLGNRGEKINDLLKRMI